MAGVESEGVQIVGEVISRTTREAIVESDFRNAWISGAQTVLQLTAARMTMLIARAGPYDDTRALQETVEWVHDTMKAIHSPEFYQATMEKA